MWSTGNAADKQFGELLSRLRVTLHYRRFDYVGIGHFIQQLLAVI